MTVNLNYVESKQRLLSNYGCILVDIPKDLFNKLKVEANSALHQNKILSTGLTGNGVPKHFELKDDNLEELNVFVLSLVDEYLANNDFYLKLFNSNNNPTPLKCERPWFNFQKKHEFIPMHTHDGVLSYSAWLNIPYNEVDEHTYGQKLAGSFQFSYLTIAGHWATQEIFTDKSCEGKLLLFPSNLPHCVYPFYSSDEHRISMSGNISFDTFKSRIEKNT